MDWAAVVHKLNVSCIRKIFQKRQVTWCHYLILVIICINVPMANDKLSFSSYTDASPACPAHVEGMRRRIFLQLDDKIFLSCRVSEWERWFVWKDYIRPLPLGVAKIPRSPGEPCPHMYVHKTALLGRFATQQPDGLQTPRHSPPTQIMRPFSHCAWRCLKAISQVRCLDQSVVSSRSDAWSSCSRHVFHWSCSLNTRL